MEFSGNVLNPAEAEILVRELRPFPITELGCERWKTQRVAMERLNMCTHSSAVHKSDDYVKAFLVEHEKLPVILHELLVMEVWRQRVMPEIKADIAGSPTAAYLYCYYEAVLVNFLECICFYEESVLAFGDDINELIDYCWRQVSSLFADRDLLSKIPPPPSADDAPLVSLERQLEQGRLSRAMGCLSVLWFVIDRLDDLPLSASNAVLQKNDLPVGLAEVLLLEPWKRRSPAGVQKFQNGNFVDVKGDDLLRVCTPEAHAWFCIHKLLCDPQCRTRYPYTQSKKEVILRIRRFMNDTLTDQIPALASVQRALEELSFLEPPSGTEEKFKSTLIIEPVPRLMSSIDTRASDWAGQATRMRRMLNDPSERAKDAMQMASLFDEMFQGHE